MSKKTKTTALVLMLIILTSKITGFFRDIVLAQTFGAGEITDAYLTALNIPVVLFDGISAALGTTFIPIYLAMIIVSYYTTWQVYKYYNLTT